MLIIFNDFDQETEMYYHIKLPLGQTI